jgi:hypothetical protein
MNWNQYSPPRIAQIRRKMKTKKRFDIAEPAL